MDELTAEYNKLIITSLSPIAKTVFSKIEAKAFAIASPAYGVTVFALPEARSADDWYKNSKGNCLKGKWIGSIDCDGTSLDVLDWDEDKPIPSELEKANALEIPFVGIGQPLGSNNN